MNKTFQDKTIRETLKEIQNILRLQIAKRTLSKDYYEYRISKVKINDLKIPLYKLWNLAFERGVCIRT